jgi:hypothetical protein
VHAHCNQLPVVVAVRWVSPKVQVSAEDRPWTVPPGRTPFTVGRVPVGGIR